MTMEIEVDITKEELIKLLVDHQVKPIMEALEPLIARVTEDQREEEEALRLNLARLEYLVYSENPNHQIEAVVLGLRMAQVFASVYIDFLQTVEEVEARA